MHYTLKTNNLGRVRARHQLDERISLTNNIFAHRSTLTFKRRGVLLGEVIKRRCDRESRGNYQSDRHGARQKGELHVWYEGDIAGR